MKMVEHVCAHGPSALAPGRMPEPPRNPYAAVIRNGQRRPVYLSARALGRGRVDAGAVWCAHAMLAVGRCVGASVRVVECRSLGDVQDVCLQVRCVCVCWGARLCVCVCVRVLGGEIVCVCV